MCGISAIVNLSRQKNCEHQSHLIEQMNRCLSYRGPDAQGKYVDACLGSVGHTRLSIIDVDERANQPFFSPDRQSCVVFNGEIFNYEDIKRRLQVDHAVRFHTKSDTEVLLAAYDVWGDSCVNEFNGMWAFIILDRRKGRVFCSRDRFGMKPFLFATANCQLYVASEAKAILKVAPEFRKPNFRSLSLLLRSSVGGQNYETCFDGIKRLPPAHNLIIENGVVKIERYWEYPLSTADSGESATKSNIGEFRELLDDSVRLWSQSDVPLGFALSGGLDSSALLSVFRKNSDRETKSYTATFSHPLYRKDESQFAREMSKRLGVENTEVQLEKADVGPIMIKLIKHLEAPHASEPMLAYWKIMEHAGRDVRVMIEGQGADELLAGYASSIALPVLQSNFASGNVEECFRTIYKGLSGAFGFGATSFLSTIARSMMPSLHRPFRNWRGDERVYQNELLAENADSYEVPREDHQTDRLNRVLMKQHENGLVNLLQYGDAISMAHSVESRSPFLDHRLVEFCFRLAGTTKYQNGFTKYILRESMRGDLPDSMLNQSQKRGFDIPTRFWFAESMDSLVRPILHSDACRQRGLLDQQRVAKLLKSHESLRCNLSSQIFRWILLELWFQHFID